MNTVVKWFAMILLRGILLSPQIPVLVVSKLLRFLSDAIADCNLDHRHIVNRIKGLNTEYVSCHCFEAAVKLDMLDLANAQRYKSSVIPIEDLYRCAYLSHLPDGRAFSGHESLQFEAKVNDTSVSHRCASHLH